MKIPGTPRRMEYKLDGVLDNLKKGMEEFSATFTVTAEQFNSTFAEAFGLNQDLDINMKNVSLGVVESKPKIVETTLDDYMKTTVDPDTTYFITDSPPKFTSEPQARLTPAICSCCGGRIGINNTCEYCGTRYW